MTGNGIGLGMGWMWLFGLILIVGVALLEVAVRALGGGIRRDRSAATSRHDRARRILDERRACGALSTEEYRERLRVVEEPR